jgi:hypothetical protein
MQPELFISSRRRQNDSETMRTGLLKRQKKETPPRGLEPGRD